ncbi:hypothetical protein AJ80_05928 [Polytolypa hystricis UAMH7299]|uniref:Protein YAE1 n=1 Tax=Polytolypa hystricis (strain UAMH7299) TaxID=1447883 RepID=A0A2B7Y0K6_POLH7|nr:hypothetical protein AJ80_05928 [Polytolypa hystricis UAMH7299]
MSPSSTATTPSPPHSSPHPSTPPSPTTTMSASPPLDPQTTSLDDIFGSSPPYSAPLSLPTQTTHTTDTAGPSTHVPELSDLPRLRRQHVTAGYRDAISVSKQEHVQRGFDAGFPVGAELGIRVGIVLGVLEGLSRCEGSAKKGEKEKEKEKEDVGVDGIDGVVDVTGLYERAKGELSVQKVFGGVVGDGAEGKKEAEEEGDASVRLGRAGEEVVGNWEARVKKLLEQRS